MLGIKTLYPKILMKCCLMKSLQNVSVSKGGRSPESVSTCAGFNGFNACIRLNQFQRLPVSTGSTCAGSMGSTFAGFNGSNVCLECAR